MFVLASCNAPTDHELSSCSHSAGLFVVVLIVGLVVAYVWFWWQVRRYRRKR